MFHWYVVFYFEGRWVKRARCEDAETREDAEFEMEMHIIPLADFFEWEEARLEWQEY